VRSKRPSLRPDLATARALRAGAVKDADANAAVPAKPARASLTAPSTALRSPPRDAIANRSPAGLPPRKEVPHGPIVETLLERGFAVYAVNPKQLDRFRDRFTVAGAKDDRRDAHVLGDAVRTDRKSG